MNILVSHCINTEGARGGKLFNSVNASLKVIPEEELGSSEKPCKRVSIAVYLRTDIDNLVLMLDKDSIAKLFPVPSLITNSGVVYPTLLVDSGLVIGKNFIESAFTFDSAEALENFVKFSTCFPVDAIETEDSFIIVFNVIVSRKFFLSNTDFKFNNGYVFYPIESLKLEDSIQKEISKSLVLVKGDK